MLLRRSTACLALAAALPLLLSACVAAGPSGSPNAQLRASQEGELRRAGVSDACIAELDTSALTQVKGITDNSARSSRELLTKRQRIRTVAANACGTI